MICYILLMRKSFKTQPALFVSATVPDHPSWLNQIDIVYFRIITLGLPFQHLGDAPVDVPDGNFS